MDASWTPRSAITRARVTPLADLRRFGVLVALAASIAAASIAPSAQATYSGDNGEIAFTFFDGEAASIRAIPPTGGHSSPLVSVLEDTALPSFSADGEFIVFSSARVMGAKPTHIYIANADGTDVRQLTSSPSVVDRFPSFSPNGRWITFTRLNSDGNKVMRMGVDGGRATKLVGAVRDRQSFESSWGPNGRIAFTRSDGNSSEIWTMNKRGGNRVQLTENQPGTLDGSADWRPNGNQLSFTRQRGERLPQTWLVRADGSRESRLLSNAAEAVFSPNGRRLVFERNPPGSRFYTDLYIATRNGNNVTRLTHEAPMKEASSPAWRPLPPP